MTVTKPVKVTKKECLAIISDANVSAALAKDKGSDAKLFSWEIQDFMKPGDNYTGAVTRVIVTYNKGGIQSTVSYIAKLNPCRNEASFSMQSHRQFLREGHYFMVFLPEINQLMERFNQPALRLSEGYFLNLEENKEILYLEDLQPRGFKMYNRMKGIDRAHGLLVMQELGILHAASLIKEKYIGADSFQKYGVGLPCDFREELRDDPKLFENIKARFSGQLDAAIKIIEKVSGYEKVVCWLNDLKFRCLEELIDLMQPTNQFSVIIHGDCWNNNILFRYDNENNPIEAVLVDLQKIEYASPAIDLNYFLYSSFNGDVRVKHFDDFLSTYYNAFSNILKAAEMNSPFTIDELHKEFRRTQLVGCLSCLFLVPVVLAEKDDILDLADVEKSKHDKENEYTKERQAVISNMASREGGCLKSRFLEMFDEMIEHGVIS